MSRCGAVMALTAALLVAMTSASGADRGTAGAASGPHVRTCRASALTIKLGHSEAGTGRMEAALEFINRSSDDCALRGWPKLVALRTSGSSTVARTLPAADFVSYAPGVDPGRLGVPRVVIAPGRRADAIFAAADGPRSTPCAKPYRTLRITAPGANRSVSISAWIPFLDAFLPSCGEIPISPLLASADLYKG